MPEHIHMRERNLSIWAWFASIPLKVQTSHTFYICWNLAEREMWAFYCCQSPHVLDYAVFLLHVRKTGSSRVVECLSENTRPIQQDAQTTAAVLRVSASIIITYLKLKFCFTWDTVRPDDFSWSFGCSALLGCGFCKEKKIPVAQEHPLNLGSCISPRGRDAFEFA